MDNITFDEGEKREVTAIITSTRRKEAVVIASANYELTNIYDGAVVQKGSCEISKNEAIVFLDLAKKGSYELKVEANVGREVIIQKALVSVE